LPKNNRDHTVPKFLLRNFGETLHVFDKTNEGHFLRRYDEAPAWERGIESNAVGEFLKRLDYEGSRSIRNFVKNLGNPSDADRQTIALFSMVLAFRNQAFRNLLVRQIQSNYQHIVADPRLDEFRARLNRELANNTLVQKVLHEAPQWALLLYRMNWSVLVNKTRLPFWISDNPVTGYDYLFDTREHPNAFLNARGIMVHIPLSKDVQLVAADPAAYFKPKPVQEVSSVKDILHCNNIQVAAATRFIFASEDSTEIIKRMIHDETEHQFTNEYLESMQESFGQNE